MKKLSDKWLHFVAIYTGNVQEAAKIVGFHPAYVRRLIGDPLVVEAIRVRNIAVAAPGIATREHRQQFWTDVYQDTERDMKDRLRASELLGKSEKDFVDRVEQSGPGGGPIQIESKPMTEEECIAEMKKRGIPLPG